MDQKERCAKSVKKCAIRGSKIARDEMHLFSMDPHFRLLAWWEKEPVRYAYVSIQFVSIAILISFDSR